MPLGTAAVGAAFLQPFNELCEIPDLQRRMGLARRAEILFHA